MTRGSVRAVCAVSAFFVFACEQVVDPNQSFELTGAPDIEARVAGDGPPGGRPLSATLTGAAEVPGPGDPDGSGSAQVTLNQGLGQVCFDITVADVATIIAAHIHVGDASVSGPVVVNFNVAANGLSGCVAADGDLIKAIRQTPDDYYVNVHNAAFPAGALRGQLNK